MTDQPKEYMLDPVHVQINLVEEAPGFTREEFDPPCPEDAEEDATLAWHAGFAATHLNYPISVMVENRPAPDGPIYGFRFHYTNPGDGRE